jgi:GntR family transcriptional regulator/MocR family aminotransferase
VQVGRGVHTLAVEAYGHLLHREVAIAAGLRLRPLAVDAAGAAVDELWSAGAVLLTPAHQFPLGVPLAPERRRRAVEWAIDTDGLIVEDDYDGEFRYDRRAVGAMQALAPEHVAYAGTASKSLAPGLRLGWLVAPAHLVEQVVEAKRLADVQAGTLDQLTLAELIGSGAYDRHIRRSRLVYQRRLGRLVATLMRRVPDARVAGVAAGLQALVVLPEGQTEEDAVGRAAGRGLALEGLSGFGTAAHEHAPALVVGYATPPEHAYTAALARLCAALETT